jgi:hypothetical protein
MSSGGRATGDRIPKPAPVVCLDSDNNPMPRVSLGDAELLCRRAWAQWRGTGSRRHIQLTAAAPVRNAAPLRPDGTRPVRADGTGAYYGAGQLLGNPRFLREHSPR